MLRQRNDFEWPRLGPSIVSSVGLRVVYDHRVRIFVPLLYHVDLSLHVFYPCVSGPRLEVTVPTLESDMRKNRSPKSGVGLDEQIKMKQIESWKIEILLSVIYCYLFFVPQSRLTDKTFLWEMVFETWWAQNNSRGRTCLSAVLFSVLHSKTEWPNCYVA